MGAKELVIPDGVGFGNEALKNYDEGLWVPEIKFGGNAVGVTYGGNRYGHYTRIGNRCFFNCFFTLTSKGSSTGAVTVAGLPFTSASTANGGFSSIALWGSSFSKTNHVITPYVSVSSTNVTFDANPINADAGSLAAVTDVNILGTGSIMLSGSYIIA